MKNAQRPTPNATPAGPMPITVEDVSFTYPSGTHALRGVSLRIAPGEAMAIVGEKARARRRWSSTSTAC